MSSAKPLYVNISGMMLQISYPLLNGLWALLIFPMHKTKYLSFSWYHSFLELAFIIEGDLFQPATSRTRDNIIFDFLLEINHVDYIWLWR